MSCMVTPLRPPTKDQVPSQASPFRPVTPRGVSFAHPNSSSAVQTNRPYPDPCPCRLALLSYPGVILTPSSPKPISRSRRPPTAHPTPKPSQHPSKSISRLLSWSGHSIFLAFPSFLSVSFSYYCTSLPPPRLQSTIASSGPQKLLSVCIYAHLSLFNQTVIIICWLPFPSGPHSASFSTFLQPLYRMGWLPLSSSSTIFIILIRIFHWDCSYS